MRVERTTSCPCTQRIQFDTDARVRLHSDVLQLRPSNEPRVFWLAMMLIELSLLRTSTLRVRASVAAAAALYIAIAERVGAPSAVDMWDGSLYILTGLTPTRAPLAGAINMFYQLRLNPPTVPGHSLLAVQQKYSGADYAQVARIDLSTATTLA